MKSIYSFGGPFIVLPEIAAVKWGGTERSTFSNLPPSDYEAAGILVDGAYGEPRVAAMLRGVDSDALVLATPVETVLVALEGVISIVQLHYRDDDFDFSKIEGKWINLILNQEIFSYVSLSGPHVVFDAACLRQDVQENCLIFDLKPGRHTVRSGLFEPDDRTLVSLIQISRDEEGIST